MRKRFTGLCLAIFMLISILTGLVMAEEANVKTEPILLSMTVTLTATVNINPNADGAESNIITSSGLKVTNNMSVPVDVYVTDITSTYGNTFVEYDTSRVPDNSSEITWRNLGHADTLEYIAFSIDDNNILPENEVYIGTLDNKWNDNEVTYDLDVKSGYAWKNTDELNRLYPIVMVFRISGEDVEVSTPVEPEADLFQFEINMESAGDYTLQVSGGETFDVEWGDGSERETLVANGNKTHEYTDAGEYTVSVYANNLDITFKDDTKLTKLLSTLPKRSDTSLKDVFNGCSNLSSVSGNIFDNAEQIADFGYAFKGCVSLNSIPATLFKACVNANSFNHIFNGCTGLTALPEELFSTCTSAMIFASAFTGCTGLSEIPTNLFSENSQAFTFNAVFSGCKNIEEIPEGLFRNCSNVDSFSSAFGNCSNLTVIPDELFSNCTKVTNFSGAFASCRSLTAIPTGLFDSTKNTVLNFSSVFGGCTEIESTVPELWNTHTKVTNSSYAFMSCTKAENYEDIPSAWKD